MIIAKTDQIIEIPPEVAVCPKCAGKLYANIDEWEQCDDGSWIASNPHTECEHEPDIDSSEWRAWFDWHYDMPYVDWLPVDYDVEKWLEENYRFDIDE
mgnify:CR=1 FL=1